MPGNRLRRMVGDATRFLITGAANTTLTTLAYQVLLFVLPRSASYAIAWLGGLIFVSVAYPRYVFQQIGVGWAKVALNAVFYVFGFLLGLIALEFYARYLNDRLAIFAVLATVTPINFLVARAVFRRPARVADGPRSGREDEARHD